MDPAEFEAFRRRHRTVHYVTWSALIVGAGSTGYVIDLLSNPAVGSAAAGVVAVVGALALPHWLRARRLRRFPELRILDFKWRRDAG